MDNQDFQLAQQIAELKGIVTEGFRAVHQRQDTTNGRIGSVEKRVNEIEKNSEKEDGIRTGVRMSWGFIITMITIMGIVIASLYYIKTW